MHATQRVLFRADVSHAPSIPIGMRGRRLSLRILARPSIQMRCACVRDTHHCLSVCVVNNGRRRDPSNLTRTTKPSLQTPPRQHNHQSVPFTIPTSERHALTIPNSTLQRLYWPREYQLHWQLYDDCQVPQSLPSLVQIPLIHSTCVG